MKFRNDGLNPGLSPTSTRKSEGKDKGKEVNKLGESNIRKVSEKQRHRRVAVGGERGVVVVVGALTDVTNYRLVNDVTIHFPQRTVSTLCLFFLHLYSLLLRF